MAGEKQWGSVMYIGKGFSTLELLLSHLIGIWQQLDSVASNFVALIYGMSFGFFPINISPDVFTLNDCSLLSLLITIRAPKIMFTSGWLTQSKSLQVTKSLEGKTVWYSPI